MALATAPRHMIRSQLLSQSSTYPDRLILCSSPMPPSQCASCRHLQFESALQLLGKQVLLVDMATGFSDAPPFVFAVAAVLEDGELGVAQSVQGIELMACLVWGHSRKDVGRVR